MSNAIPYYYFHEYGTKGDVELSLVLFGSVVRPVYSTKPVTKRFML